MRAVVVIVFGAFILLTWLQRAWFGRWIADDFCFAVSSQRDGFWRAQALMYEGLTGRFSVAFFMGAVTRLGQWTTRYMAIGAMMVWLAVSWRAARLAFASVRADASPIEEAAAGVLFVAAILAAAPDDYQPLIWLGGLATYGLPIIGATVIAWLILRHVVSPDPSPSHRLIGVIAMIAFVGGGCSEVAAAAQVICAAAVALFSRRVRPLLFATAISSTVAMALVAAAPGNFRRRTMFTALPMSDAATTALVEAPTTFAAIVMQGAIPFFLLVAFIALAGTGLQPGPRRTSIVTLLSSITIVVITLFGSLYGTGRLPWGRVQFVPVAYTAIAFVFLGVAARGSLMERRAVAKGLTIAMAMICAIEIASTANLRLHAIDDARQFAIAADEVQGLARQQKGRDLVVRAPRTYEFLEFVGSDPALPTNRCMAEYYGLTSIRTALPQPSRR